MAVWCGDRTWRCGAVTGRAVAVWCGDRTAVAVWCGDGRRQVVPADGSGGVVR